MNERHFPMNGTGEELEKVAVGTAGNLPSVGALCFLSDCLGLGSGVIPPSELLFLLVFM